MGILNVTTLQQGLAQWAQSVGGESPGRIDGKWGPITHESLRAFVSSNARQLGVDAARVLAPLRALRTGASVVELDDRVVERLEALAAQSESPSAPRGLTMRERYDEAMRAGNVEGDYARALTILLALQRDMTAAPARYTDEQRAAVAEGIRNLQALTGSDAPVWPWVLGGGVLVLGLGYWLYRRFGR